jgi:hypothetical protein
MIDQAVGNRTEHQLRLSFVGAFDDRPAIVRIDASQVRQLSVDGMCVDIDEAGGDGQLSVDGWLRATGETGRFHQARYYAFIIQDVYAQ